MKKSLFLTLGVLFISFVSMSAQVAAYKFTGSSGTYTPITGGTVLGNSSTDDQRFVDPATPLGGTTTAGPGFPIGFNFTFGGTAYDKVGVNANGWITLGSSTVSVPSGSSPISGSATQVAAAFARDLVARAGAEIRIETIGTTPNQKLVVQWSNYKRYTSTAGGFDTDSINFQVVLNETSNTIEFIYGNVETAATLTGDPIVGIKGATTTNYITLDGSFGALLKGTSTTATVDFNSTSAPAPGQVITFSPPTCFLPTALTATALTPTSATLGWTTGGAAQWNVEYGALGFSLGSGTRVNVLTTPSTAITGLTGGNTYSFFVRDSCGAGDVGNWVGPFTFTTPCVALSTFPYIQDFESATTGSPGVLPSCWTITNSTTYRWEVDANGTPSSATGPLVDHTLGTITGKYVFVEASNGTAGSLAYLNVPALDASALVAPQLDFYYHMFGSQVAGLWLEAYNTGAAKWDTIYSIVGQQQTSGAAPWVKAVVSLTSVKSSNLQLRFVTRKGTGTLDYEGDVALDDIFIGEAPSCASPTLLGAFGITATGAQIYWTSGGASNWNIEYGLTGFTLGSGSMVNSTNDTLLLSGLNAATTYQFYVRDSCGVGSTSTWSGPFSFTTPCAAVSLPFTETWEVTSATLGCWSSQANWGISTAASANGVGSNSLIFPFYTVNGGSFDAFSPEFTPAPVGYQLSFAHAYATYQTEVDSAKIYYSTDGGLNYALLVGLDGGPSGALTTAPPAGLVSFVPTATQWANYTIVLPAGTNKLKITAKSAFGNNLYLDNITVEMIPACPAPTVLGATNITSSDADVYWTTGGSANWNVEYGATGFVLGSGIVLPLVANDTVGLSGLVPQTCYDFYVQDVCTSDSSSWTGPFNFCTPPVSAACNVTNTLENDTLCSPGVSSYASLNSNDLVVLNSSNQVILTTDTVSINATTTTSLQIAEVGPGIASGHVGPLTNIATTGFGNFTNGQWISAIDTIRIDSMTVRANGVVQANLQVYSNDPALGGTLLQVGETFTTGAATADYQVPVGVVLTPGSYFINVSFTGGTGMLFRATGGAVYPYVLAGLMSIDSTNFAGPRMYYTFDMVVSEVCLSPAATVTTHLIGQNPGVGRSVVLCDNAAAVNLTSYLSASADAGGTFVSPTASAGISGTMFNPALVNPGIYKVYYKTLGTSACPADSSEFDLLVQNCSGCATLTIPTLTGDTICGPGVATLSGTTSATGIIWYNAADSILSYENSFMDTISANTTYKAQSVFRAGPSLTVGPPVTINQNPYPTGNFTNGQYISVGTTVRIDSATFAVNGALDFVVIITDPQKTVIQYVSKLISFNGADTAQKEIGIVLPAGQYFMGIASIAGSGVLWRMTAGGNFPYGSAGYFTADSSDFGPTRYYYFHDMKISSACLSPTTTVSAIVAPGFNAGNDATANVCDTLMVDLTSYLGTFDPGGTWRDVNGTGALTGNIFDAYQVAKNASYSFQYYGGTTDCQDTATINLFVDFCSIGIEEYGNSGITVYPNPASASIFVEEAHQNSQQMTLEIYSINGQLVYRKSFTGSGKAQVEINDLADGIYNLRVITDESTSMHRIVKQ